MAALPTLAAAAAVMLIPPELPDTPEPYLLSAAWFGPASALGALVA